MKLKTIFAILGLILIAACSLSAQQYNLKWMSVDCGGNTAAVSSNFKVGLSTAITVAGSAESPNYHAFLGFWFPHAGLSLLVDEDQNGTLPTGFSLAQNYPNPFNPQTTIDFALKNAEWVRLTVYNAIGQQVAVLVDQPLPVGSYRAEWDGQDQSGVAVASGVYLYSLVAGDFTASRKMLLLK